MGHGTLEVAKHLKVEGVGIDFSNSAIQKAVNLQKGLNPPISFQVRNFHDPYFLEESQKFKVIFSLDGLYGLKNWEEYDHFVIQSTQRGGENADISLFCLERWRKRNPPRKFLEVTG